MKNIWCHNINCCLMVRPTAYCVSVAAHRTCNTEGEIWSNTVQQIEKYKTSDKLFETAITPNEHTTKRYNAGLCIFYYPFHYFSITCACPFTRQKTAGDRRVFLWQEKSCSWCSEAAWHPIGIVLSPLPPPETIWTMESSLSEDWRLNIRYI